MYHAHFRGTHYEAGFRWGSLLLKHRKFILDNIPFEITPERLEYAQSCIPIYEEYCPEILEEIKGLADGQECDIRTLQAVLFSMYVMPPACNCSCFAITTENDILMGRNSDFLTDIEKLNQNVIYKLSDGAFSFMGNTTAFVEIEDGINELGLAIGLTSVYPYGQKVGLNAGIILRLLLEKCRTVEEAGSYLGKLPIASAQTFTLADTDGNIAVIECNSERTKTVRFTDAKSSFVCATNVFHHPDMLIYNNLAIDNWFAERRYQTMTAALNDKNILHDLTFAKRLLAGECGFLCQYDRETGKDTVWSVIYDVQQRKIYRTEKNPKYTSFKEDKRFKFADM